MQITLDLPEQTIRKVKAFNILTGGAAADMEGILVTLIDETLSAAIVNAVHGTEETPPDLPWAAKQAPASHPAMRADAHAYQQSDDASGISGGLGDEYEDEGDGKTTDEMAFVPKAGGVSGLDLEHDMEVDDPEHEAKVDASAVALSGATARPEKLFAQMADMPEPSIPDPREARRRKPLKSKAKVTRFSGDEKSTF